MAVHQGEREYSLKSRKLLQTSIICGDFVWVRRKSLEVFQRVVFVIFFSWGRVSRWLGDFNPCTEQQIVRMIAVFNAREGIAGSRATNERFDVRSDYGCSGPLCRSYVLKRLETTTTITSRLC